MIFEGDCVVRTATGAVLRCSVLGVRLVQRGFRCSVLTARFSVLGKGPPRRQRKRQQVVFRNPQFGIRSSQFAVRSSELAVRPREPAVNNHPSYQGRSLFIILGNAIVSRRCGKPQIHATVRSSPNPNPAWVNVPYLRKSRYQP